MLTLPQGSDTLNSYCLDGSCSNCVPPYPMLGPNSMLKTRYAPGLRTIWPLVKSIPEYLNALDPSHTSYAQMAGPVHDRTTFSPPVFSAIRHYPTIALAGLKRLEVASIAADDSLLFLWSTSPHLDQAIELGKAWGFEWATVAFVWDKVRVNPGFYTLSQCELCLAFKRGRIPSPRGARNVRQLVRSRRGPHSAKPSEVRERIEAMFPRQRRIELFARTEAPGWDSWGLGVCAVGA